MVQIRYTGRVISYREGVGCFDALVLVELHDGFALPDARTPLDEDADVIARGGICRPYERKRYNHMSDTYWECR